MERHARYISAAPHRSTIINRGKAVFKDAELVRDRLLRMKILFDKVISESRTNSRMDLDRLKVLPNKNMASCRWLIKLINKIANSLIFYVNFDKSYGPI